MSEPMSGDSMHEAPPALKVDLHVHTRHSPDATTTPADLVERAAEAGLDRIAVTDHGVLEGALEARELDPERVIVGEEIRCRGRTEVIGLYLRERIPTGLPLRETVERIRDQGGLVYVPHPYAYAWKAGWHARRALAVADLVEVFNARAFLPAWNRAARAEAAGRGLPTCAGSDSHFPAEIGRAHTELPAFRNAWELLAAAGRARPVGRRVTSPWYHVASAGLKAFRVSLGGWKWPPRRGYAPAARTVPAER